MAVDVAVEGERRHPHVGKTIFIDNQVDNTTSTFLVRAEVANPEGSILPGQYIKATITVGDYVDAVVVPEQSVVEGQEGHARLCRRRGRTRCRPRRSARLTSTMACGCSSRGSRPGRK